MSTRKPLTSKPSVRLQDIAERCGVSKMTVSLALREHPSISQGTAERVRAMAEEMGYDPAAHDVARRLALRKSGQTVRNHAISLVLPPHFSQTPFLLEILEGVLMEADAAGYALVIIYYNFEDPTPHQPLKPLPAFFTAHGVDGLMMYNIERDSLNVIRFLKEFANFGDRPVVSLGGRSLGFSAVVADDYNSTVNLTTHLLELGHRHLLYLHPVDMPDFCTKRLAAARHTLRQWELDPDTHLQELAMPGYWTNGNLAPLPDAPPDSHGMQTLLTYLRAHPEITGIVSWNDLSALIVKNGLQENGLRVPEEYSLVGFDDYPCPADPWVNSELTTAHIPLVDIGREATKLVIRQIEQDTTTLEIVTLPAEIVVRQSTRRVAGC